MDTDIYPDTGYNTNMDTKRQTEQKMVDELEKYADFDHTEVGELCGSLCDVYTSITHASDEFKYALIREIEWHLHNYKKHCTIVDEDVSVVHRVTSLVWDDE